MVDDLAPLRKVGTGVGTRTGGSQLNALDERLKRMRSVENS
jgi:hypothetical protein